MIGKIMALIVLLTAVGCQIAGASTIYVDSGGWWVEENGNDVPDVEEYNSSSTPISSAVNYATAGDTVIVKDGTYSESVQVDKRLTLRSQNGSANCFILSPTPNPSTTVLISADYVRIGGFTISSSGAINGYPTVQIQADHVNLTNCIVENYYPVSNGYDYGNGIIVNGDNCTIAGNLIRNCDEGVIVNSNYTEVESNEFSNVQSCIVLSNAWNCSIHNNEGNVELSDSHFNEVFDNDCSNYDYGIYMLSSGNNTIENNNATFCTYGGIYMSRSDSNDILSNNCSSSYYGIALYYSSYNTINNNTCLDNTYAVLLDYDQSLGTSFTSMYNDISENNCSVSTYGIYENYASSNRIINNSILGNQYGLYFTYSGSNDVSDNVIANNDYGAYLDHSDYNWICFNSFSGNDYGMYLLYSNDSEIFMNDFADSTNVYSENSDNCWNSSQEVTYAYGDFTFTNYTGNHWNDYTGSDDNVDGIGDTPYQIDTNDYDYYPLMGSFEEYFILGLGGEINPPIPELPVVMLACLGLALVFARVKF